MEESPVNEQLSEESYTIDYNIITGKVELSDEQAVAVLVQLWDNAIKAGAINAQDSVLIQKAIKIVSDKLLPQQ